MDINWLEDFVCFARLLSFTGAANERNITQSAFSRRIQSLELWVGVDLVERKTYPARLSKAGEEFLPTAKSTLMHLYRTRDDIRAKSSLGTDLIGFAAPHTVSIHCLSPMLQQLEQTKLGARTRVLSDDLHTCCEYLNEGISDFLVCYRHKGIPLTLDEQRFERLDLLQEKLIPVVSSSVFSRHCNSDPAFPTRAFQSGRLPYLAFPSGSFLGTVVETLLAQNNTGLQAAHTDAFSEAIKSRAMLGAGLAWLPQTAVQTELSDGRLRSFEDKNWTASLTLSAYTERERTNLQVEKVWRWIALDYAQAFAGN